MGSIQETLLQDDRAIGGRKFVVARNPDVSSSLPYLVTIPVGAGLVLKAREPWPVHARVYCHRHHEPVPAEAEVLQEVPVRMCTWRGPAVDLVLDRSRHNRSQFVFTTVRRRPAIFWQTPSVTRRARPRLRLPAHKGAQMLTIEVGALGFAMADLSSLATAAVVVEDRFSALLSYPRVNSSVLLDVLVRLQVRYPSVPIVFTETRKLAEHWTHRFLAAAKAEYGQA